MIVPTLIQKIGEAMKARDAVRVSTLRMLSSEFKNEKINLQHDLTDEEELKVVRKEAKKRKEAIEMYSNANATERIESEKQELSILQEYLPPEISEDEIVNLVDDSITVLNAIDISMMGKVIADVKLKNPNVDGGVVAKIVREKLSGKQ